MQSAPITQSVSFKFTLPSEFVASLKLCFERAQSQLQLFDPDFSRWGLDQAEVFVVLRRFLLLNPNNRLQLAMHRTEYLQNDCKRFMPFFNDFSHAIECRITPRNLRQLTDSFCIADDLHIVRRYHCDHFRGETVFDSAEATQLSAKRFGEIHEASEIGIHASRLGL